MNKQLDQRLMDIFKVSSITHEFAISSLGPICLQLNKGDNEYVVLLDSVRVDKNTNQEVLELLKDYIK
jgi:hypothetical protein